MRLASLLIAAALTNCMRSPVDVGADDGRGAGVRDTYLPSTGWVISAANDTCATAAEVSFTGVGLNNPRSVTVDVTGAKNDHTNSVCTGFVDVVMRYLDMPTLA